MVLVIKKPVVICAGNSSAKSLPDSNVSGKLFEIRKLVAASIESTPYHHNDFDWAKHPQGWWVNQLGFSVETFRRLISKPPFVRDCIIDPETGKKVTLIREGAAGPKTKKHVQNILAKIWHAKTGRRIVGVQYGHMGGLVDAWGIEHASEIFKLVLNDVPAFMAGAKIKIAGLGTEGYYRFYKDFPPTGFILRFNEIGCDMYLMKKQASFASTSLQSAEIPF